MLVVRPRSAGLEELKPEIIGPDETLCASRDTTAASRAVAVASRPSRDGLDEALQQQLVLRRGRVADQASDALLQAYTLCVLSSAQARCEVGQWEIEARMRTSGRSMCEGV